MMRSPILQFVGAGFLAAVTFAGCSDGITDPNDLDPVPETACASTVVASPTTPDLALERITDEVHRPTALAFAPGQSRFYVTQQFDGVRVVEPDGSVHPFMFIDKGGQVSIDIEQGVSGITFDPGFDENGFLYITFTDLAGDLKLARYQVTDDPDRAQEHSVLLTVEQPDSRHQGGEVAFGPDGMLYVGLGDGGVSHDLEGHSQNTGNLLGTLLRIDVRGGGAYQVPPDNPFVGAPDAMDEIWAYGLRNPWSFSHDAVGGCLYVTDVGEALREEVNAVRNDMGGLNFGWNLMEGFNCFQPDQPDVPGQGCDTTGLVLPILDYAQPSGCQAVIGGHVYRGSEIPGLEGMYLYMDFCDNWMRGFRLENNAPVQQAEWTFPELDDRPVHIGRDPSGELYVLTWNGGLFRLVPQP